MQRILISKKYKLIDISEIRHIRGLLYSPMNDEVYETVDQENFCDEKGGRAPSHWSPYVDIGAYFAYILTGSAYLLHTRHLKQTNSP